MTKAKRFKFNDSGVPVRVRVEDLLSRMSLEEKVAQLGSVGPEKILEKGKFSPEKADKVLKNGIGQITRVAGAGALEPEDAAEAANAIQKYLKEETRLGIPAILHEECLSGFMGKRGTTYPQSIGTASTWDPELMEKITAEIRKQLRAVGAHLALSPVADVARDMRWGRVEETFGEDQYLVAMMVAAYVRGLQTDDPGKGIYATLKHFAGYSVSEGGRNHAPVNISPREFRENFLFPFEAGVNKAGAGSIMNAYHDIDGIPCAASSRLLTDILRGEWGFEGIVVSDYFSIEMLATEHMVAANKKKAGIMALEAGLDVELPETECYGERLLEAVHEGLVSVGVIDRAVRRHLTAKFRMGLFEDCYVRPQEVGKIFETPDQRSLAREAARKSAVLLKNEEDLLPLNKNIDSLALIGPSADSTRLLLGDYAYSAHVESKEDAVEIVTIREGIEEKISANVDINYARGCDIMDLDRSGFKEAVVAASDSDVAVVVLGGKSGLSGMGENEGSGEDEVVDFTNVEFTREMKATSDTTGEHHDRIELGLPGVQQELLQSVYNTGTPVVLVLINGRPLSINWAAEKIPAILEAWLPGEEGGSGIADVLFGDYSPAGKLPVSIPAGVGQTPINYNRKDISHNRDYVFANNRPLYPFGHGLSYTDFSYSDLEISPEEIDSIGKVRISMKIENCGRRAGEEVVQLYIKDQIASRSRPVKELKGFAKLSLEPGQSKKVIFTLSTEQLAFYDRDMNLILEPGKFNVMVGSSSVDIRLKGEFTVKGEKKEITGERVYFTDTEVE